MKTKEFYRFQRILSFFLMLLMVLQLSLAGIPLDASATSSAGGETTFPENENTISSDDIMVLSTGSDEKDNWKVGVVFYDSSVENGTTALTSVNWDASNGDYAAGEPRVIKVQINYENTNAVTTYEVGSLKFKIPNLIYGTAYSEYSNTSTVLFGNYEAQWDSSAVIGANDSTHTGYEWNFTSATAPTHEQEYYEFTNAVVFEKDSNFQGSILLEYTITPLAEITMNNYLLSVEKYENECTHTFTKDLQATLYDSALNVLAASESVNLSYTRTYTHNWQRRDYTFEKTAEKITSYDGLPANAEDYTWVKYVFAIGPRATKYNSVHPYIGLKDAKLNAGSAKLYDTFPADCVVYDSRGTKLSPQSGNLYVADWYTDSTTYQTDKTWLFVGYPKAVYNDNSNNLNVSNSADLYLYYDNGTDFEYHKTATVNLNLGDFEFNYKGELYGVSKALSSTYGSSKDKKMRYQDIVKDGTYNETGWAAFVTAIYTGTPMTVKFGDDVLFATDTSGNYVKLEDGEYYFTRMEFPSLKNGNGSAIPADKYDCELWVRYSGSNTYTKYADFKNAADTKTWTFTNEDQVAGYYFLVKDMRESINDAYIWTTVNFNKADIPESGTLYNFNYIQVYFKGADGNLVLQNEPDIDSYGNLNTKDLIAAYDQATYGVYVQRDCANALWYSYDACLGVQLGAYKKVDSSVKQDEANEEFTGRFYLGATIKPDSVYNALYNDYYKENEAALLSGFVVYDLLPKGMELASTKEEILDSLIFTEVDYAAGSRTEFYDRNFNKLSSADAKAIVKNATTITVIEDWNNTGRTRVEIKADFSANPFYVVTTASNGSTYQTAYRYTLNYRITYDSYLAYGSTYQNYSYAGFAEQTAHPKKVLIAPTVADSGVYDPEAADIDGDANTAEELSYASGTATISSVVSTHQDVQTTVRTDKSDYATGTVKATPETAYSYKLRVRSGASSITNLVIVDNLEEAYGSNKYWKGEFTGIDTSFAEDMVYKIYDLSNAAADANGYVEQKLSVKVYYSENANETGLYQTKEVTENGVTQTVWVTDANGMLVKNSNWAAYLASTDKTKVKSIAFEFLNAETGEPAIIPSNSLVYVEILMKAPNETAAFEGTLLKYAYNQCFTQWNAVDEFNQTVDFITGINSNTVKVSLADKISIPVVKTWVDNNDALGLRPDKVVFILKKDGTEVDRQTLTSGSDRVVFSNIEIENVGRYTVEEEDLALYVTDGVTYNESAGRWEVTNTLSDDVYTTITGTKTWVGDTAAQRPETITVNLLNKGEVTRTTTTSAAKNWQYSFVNVPKYNKDGSLCQYSVSEEAVDGYTTAYGEPAEGNGLAITFNDQFHTESGNWDYVEIYYKLDGKTYKLGRWSGTSLAGQTIEVPTTDFYLYWKTDSSNCKFYGFSIDSIVGKDVSVSSASAAPLPSYEVEEICGKTYPESPHSPYVDNVNKIWHYTAKFTYDAPEVGIYDIINTLAAFPLEFTKTDFFTGEAITDVTFKLYELVCANSEAGHEHGKAGSTNCWISVSETASDGNGNVSLDGLANGKTYGVVETAPDGYALPDGLYWEVTVAEDGAISWETVYGGSEDMELVNSYKWLGYSFDVQVKADGSFALDNIMALREVNAVKRIKASNINFANGTPTFIFELTGTDISGQERTYYEAVCFTEDYVEANTASDGYTSLTAVFRNVAPGNYVLSEEEVSRYEFEAISNVINGSISGETVIFDLITNEFGEAVFTNRVYENQWFSHNDIVINNINFG